MDASEISSATVTGLELPTLAERLAQQLRRQQGLTDGEIGALLGVARETVNRRGARFAAKLPALPLAGLNVGKG